jgi:hypothetical protein
MKPLEFLAAVLPSAGHGHYCVAKLGATRKEHRFSEDTSAFRPQIKKWLEHSGDVYFALATFEDPSKGPCSSTWTGTTANALQGRPWVRS